MSSKFSRRSTRVQHTPHVCISTPDGDVLQLPLQAQVTHSHNLLVFTPSFQNSSWSVAGQAIEISPNQYAITGNDTNGRACTLRFQLIGGQMFNVAVSVTGLHVAPPQATDTTQIWSGSVPSTDGPFGLTLSPGVSGSATTTIGTTVP